MKINLFIILALIVGIFFTAHTFSNATAAENETKSMENKNIQTATFGAGCFWGVELTFSKVKGVISTEVGYSGGHTDNPSYKEVCTNKTGHAEVIRVQFDPSVVSYNDLLNVFWELHDPTQMNRQGPDVGTQYRSAIFYHTPEQKTTAEASKKALAESGKYKRPIATEITAATTFYPAEEYHQKYLEKRGRGACKI